jgi:hypothetical protein
MMVVFHWDKYWWAQPGLSDYNETNIQQMEFTYKIMEL